MEFKTYREGKVYCYLGIAPPSSQDGVLPGGDGNKTEDNSNRLGKYLRWATSLTEGRKQWVIIRETPEAAQHFNHLYPVRVNWKYDVVTNDTEGMGIDKGFVPVEKPFSQLHHDQGPANILFQLPDLMSLQSLSEDAFGDVDSHITILATEIEESNIVKLFNSRSAPHVGNIMGAEGFFINVVVGKEQGFYDSLLVKSGANRERKFNSFKP